MNGHVQETQGAWWRLSQKQQKRLIVLLGQMIRHQMEQTIHKQETTARNAVDKILSVRQGGVDRKQDML